MVGWPGAPGAPWNVFPHGTGVLAGSYQRCPSSKGTHNLLDLCGAQRTHANAGSVWNSYGNLWETSIASGKMNEIWWNLYNVPIQIPMFYGRTLGRSTTWGSGCAWFDVANSAANGAGLGGQTNGPQKIWLVLLCCFSMFSVKKQSKFSGVDHCRANFEHSFFFFPVTFWWFERTLCWLITCDFWSLRQNLISSVT